MTTANDISDAAEQTARAILADVAAGRVVARAWDGEVEGADVDLEPHYYPGYYGDNAADYHYRREVSSA
jgi:hypothetical protein